LFYILDGEPRVTIGDESTVVGPGAMAYGPRNVPLTFKVESPVARWLSFATPAGFERFFFETGVGRGALRRAVRVTPLRPDDRRRRG
jgi:hypothetical protein